MSERGCIALEGVSIVLGDDDRAVQAVDGVDLDVAPGSLVAILGPSGCGKSTLLGAVAGLLRPSAGRVLVDGRPVTGPGIDRGMVFQQPTLLPWRRVLDNVAFGPKARGVPRATRELEARRLLADVGLTGFEAHLPHQLSGGMQQRVELARVLINQPSVILMDEPFAALDALTRARMQALLLEIWRPRGTTILFVTHDIDEALLLADRVVVMSPRPGRIRGDFAVDLPRPRDEIAQARPAFLELRRRCRALLGEEAPVRSLHVVPEAAALGG